MWSTGRCNRRRIDDIACKQNNVQFRMVYLPWDVVEHFKTLRYCKEHELGRCKVTENCKQSWALEVQQMTNKIYIRFNFHYAIKKISVPVDELSTVQGGSLFVLYSMLYMYLSVCSLIFVYVLPKNHMHLFSHASILHITASIIRLIKTLPELSNMIGSDQLDKNPNWTMCS